MSGSVDRTTSTPGVERDAGGLELVSKAAAVLAVLEADGPTSAADLAARLAEPLSSVYRLLQSLAATGWVERAASRGPYRLGLAWMTVAGLVEDHLDVRQACLPALRSLAADVDATTFLCVRRGPRAVCIERIEGPFVQSLAMRLGSSLPVWAGAAPRALLAFLAPAEADDALGEDVVLRGDPPRPRDRAIRADLALVRQRGYAVSDEDVTPGVASIGAPVLNHRGEVEGAISVSGLRRQVLDEPVLDRNVALLQAAASRASTALGWEA